MKRRQFLRALGGTVAAVAGFSLDNSLKLGFRTANAHTLAFGNKTLVFVYLRGGNDGINTVVPHGYADGTGYYDPGFRPTIAIPKPVSDDPLTALDLYTHTQPGSPTFEQPAAQGLGLHPAMDGLYQLYENGNLAIMPATHYANASRSHFNSQQYTESAKADLETDGWLNRYLVDVGAAPAGVIRGVGISSSLPHMLRGQELVSAFSDLRNFELGITNFDNEAEVLSRLIDVYNQDRDANRRYSDLIHDFGGVTLNDLEIVADLNSGAHPELDPDTYVSAVSTDLDKMNYGGSTFHRQIKQTANLIKAGRGLEVASLSRGGFDLHSNAGGAVGNHANALRDVSDGLLAFFDDLNVVNPETGVPYMDDVLVMVGSEFGRTSYENGSFGVDHAHATSWFAMGTSATVNGGVYLGHRNPMDEADADYNNGNPSTTPISNWIEYDPLLDGNMLRARYLNHTIDYRNLYGEILNNFLSQNHSTGPGPDLDILLPDFAYSELTKIGFLT